MEFVVAEKDIPVKMVRKDVEIGEGRKLYLYEFEPERRETQEAEPTGETTPTGSNRPEAD